MNSPLGDPFLPPGATKPKTQDDVELTAEEEARLAGLSARDRARAIGRIRKARQQAPKAPPVPEIKAPAAVPDLGPLIDGQMLDGSAQYLLLPVNQIFADPDQPRKTFRNVGELATNMKKRGLLQPITVRKAGGKYLIMYGERRWRAAQTLHWEHIGAIVKYGVKDTQLLVDQLTENSQREDLDPIEEARAVRAYMRQERIATQLEAAIALGHSLSWVSNRLALLELDGADQEAVAARQVPLLTAVKKAREKAGTTRTSKKRLREPHFGSSHDLAGIARSRCRAQTHVDGAEEHPHILNSGACGACWEAVIRQDAVRQMRMTAS
jgi:ParB/RepB/Spo0J family partition protein